MSEREKAISVCNFVSALFNESTDPIHRTLNNFCQNVYDISVVFSVFAQKIEKIQKHPKMNTLSLFTCVVLNLYDFSSCGTQNVTL